MTAFIVGMGVLGELVLFGLGWISETSGVDL